MEYQSHSKVNMCYDKKYHLDRAVESRDVELAGRLLASNEVDVNFYSEGCPSYLLMAILNNDVAMVMLLLSHNADPNSASELSCYRSPVWTAVLYGHSDIAYLLVRAGADVTETFGSSCSMYDVDATLLHAAVIRKDERLTCALLTRKADPNALDSEGQGVLQTAVIAGCSIRILYNLILHGAKANAVNSLSRSVLHSAIVRGEPEIVSLIISAGADVTTIHCSGKNALHFAAEARKENVALVKLLLAEGLHIDDLDRINLFTPLHLALKTGKDAMVRYLVERGADVNAKSRIGLFPLYLAVVHCSASIVRFLLSKGADVNDATYEGMTALHEACASDSTEKIRILIEYGADLTARDDTYKTPFMHFDDLTSDAPQMIAKEMIRLQVFDEFVDEDDFAIARAEMSDFCEGCVDEIELMQNIQFYNRFTMYYILTEAEDKIAPLLRNEDFMEAYTALQTADFFPIYKRDLEFKMEKAAVVLGLTIKMEKYLNSAFGNRLPSVALNKISSFLKPEDIPLELKVAEH